MLPATGRPPIDVPLVFVADIGRPELDDHDRHHLTRVLRVASGSLITVADGRGNWRPARLGADVDITGDVQQEPHCEPPITIAFALVKGERPEFVVQKLTELGADVVVPFVAARSVVRWEPDRAKRNHERLSRVIREAAMQSRRARLPQLELLQSFAGVVTRPDTAIADRDGDPPTLRTPTILIGPEGGWTPEERAAARTRVCLATYVLRAETAAFAACGLLSALRGGIVRAKGDA